MVLTRYSLISPSTHHTLSVDGKRLIVTAAGVAATCAVLVFASLLAGDRDHANARSQLAVLQQEKQTLTGAARSGITSNTATHLPDAASRSIIGAAARTDYSSPTHDYISFNLVRSKRFQRVAQVSVKLGRTDAKRGDYDLILLVNGRVINQRRVKLNQPVWIAPNGHAPSKIVVNRITRNRVWGYVEGPKENAEQASQKTVFRGPAGQQSAK